MAKRYGKTLALVAGTSLFLGVSSPALAADGTGELKTLQLLVDSQQQQLNSQAGEIAALKETLNSLLSQTAQNKPAVAAKADKKEAESSQPESLVVSKIPKVDVTLYGQINRAALWADNGDSNQVYFVDNIFSSSRMGLDALAGVTDDLFFGGKFEYEIISNSSLEVNQDEQDTSASLKIRHADVFVESKALGKIFLGQGSTSTDATAERDLQAPRLSPIQLSSIRPVVKSFMTARQRVYRRHRLKMSSTTWMASAAGTGSGTIRRYLQVFSSPVRRSRPAHSIALCLIAGNSAACFLPRHSVMPTRAISPHGTTSMMAPSRFSWRMA